MQAKVKKTATTDEPTAQLFIASYEDLCCPTQMSRVPAKSITGESLYLSLDACDFESGGTLPRFLEQQFALLLIARQRRCTLEFDSCFG